MEPNTRTERIEGTAITYETGKLPFRPALNLLGHVYSGYDESGETKIHCNAFASAAKHGCAWIYDHAAKQAWRRR